ncbi:hypothetical protein BATDEDRAFT_89127 [Batrachochytrium dendrobatidis JAM81]|uniref:Guanosine-3',5'-bis(diphosphate) 3'-pyrophosphohydrolase MESH1 n=2 Tax=Batrachochytrium dendrobatidis TaxID=109871 RepID=F4P465_BATDJ|nr:uncharacterized protein BATDEDRAFT_89127 [Batrachochytrium dendrobatidis JAM81]EGF79942.1 hypothetical protein BATDEDRAFT_89127 [Batrachochytrium dendrobatidis JAM81]KAJ8323276.1 Guanosine-3',5'-bis(diphosphate) 3'-pyrophosphohydrolase MESH1 [Batrachochytrium dendrobatidis]KAK5672982.1 Guanosine-3',5'-bis(diphosphate) 3'-pyrophosphohydrolase MESH1 [Batrachochytrium dendrobatidis]OAJ38879.1 hypothetical protein BDEG_22778 [Batrachochytrium dendrobatidis JEL423]|eukprot:XP_006679731.1 hypothetical protein BATDEDRAFT_89127 [Batrachochytrium dendrobatidis JAM81]
MASTTSHCSSLGQLLECINFAAIKHSSQRRKDPTKTPYINHPIGVAYILYYEGNVEDLPTLLAAVLHDTVEDTETSFEEITAKFGSEVCEIVMACTDDKTLPSKDRKRLQVETAPHKSDKAKLVKMADKIYNLRDLMRVLPMGWTQQRANEYFAWAKQVTDGCRGVNAKLDAILNDIYKKQEALESI